MYGNHYYNQPQRFQQYDNLNQQYAQPFMPATQQIQQPTNQIGLLGKSVESIDVARVMDIPLDGSVSYFPLTDGSAIVTKKLQRDGTSKTVVYKPVEENKNELPRYATIEEMEEMLGDFDINDIKDLKDQINDLRKQIKEIKEYKPKKDK